MFVELIQGLAGDVWTFWLYVGFFLVILIEGLPLIGSFIPGGSIILLLAGILSRLGYFSLYGMALNLIIASIITDTIGYFFGRSCAKRSFRRVARSLFVKKGLIEGVRKIVHGHTGKALIIGRLNPITRSIAPFVVGNERVPFAKFIFFNIVGGITWVFMLIFIGYIFGASVVVEKVEWFIIISTGILVGGYYTHYIFDLLKNKLRNGGGNGACCKE